MVKFRSTMREGEPGECLFHCCWCDTYPTLYRVNKEGFNFACNSQIVDSNGASLKPLPLAA